MKKYFASFLRRITTEVTERACDGHPYPNADGTIDYYEENMGRWESLCSFHCNSFDEAIEYVKVTHPTICKEDDWEGIIATVAT